MKYLLHHLSLTILLLVALTSCGTGQSKQQSENASLPALKIGAMSSMDYIPYMVAQKVGIYDSLGLQLEIVKFFGANDRDAALRSGSLDGTVIDYTGAALQHANGVDISLVVKHDGIFDLMVPSNIESVTDLKGKRVAISRNTVIEYSIDRMLSLSGLTPDAIEKVEINKIPLRMEMLIAGEIEASVFPEPFISLATQKGLHSIISTQGLGYTIVGTVFTAAALQEKRDAIVRLLEGYNLGVAYMQQHPRSEWQQILIDDAMVPEHLAATIPLPPYTPAELPSDADISATITWLKEKGLVPSDYTGAGLVNSSILVPQQ